MYCALIANTINPKPNCKIPKANLLGVVGFLCVFDKYTHIIENGIAKKIM